MRFCGIHLKCSSYLSSICVWKIKITIASHRGHWWVESSPPTAAYMRQWTGPPLVQAMACRLIGAKPLPEPVLAYCQLDSWEHISVKFESEFYHFHSRKCNWKCDLSRGNELNHCTTSLVHGAMHDMLRETFAANELAYHMKTTCVTEMFVIKPRDVKVDLLS